MSAPNSSESNSFEEAARLKSLYRYDILNTPPEEQFDRITRLAARWFDVPIALITLLDKDRQWFKAVEGIDFCETSREAAFCARNIQSDTILTVEDATEDPRFADNPLVRGQPGIRFYAGAPLKTSNGHRLGSLCLIDTTPRSAEGMDLSMLRDLAEIVVDELELRAVSKDLEEKNQKVKELVRELKSAEESKRRHLSQLLHEDLQQVLQAARMTSQTLSGADSLTEKKADQVERLTESIEEAFRITRDLSARFAPPIANQPLPDTLQWLARKIEEDHGLSVSLQIEGAASMSDETVKRLLYHTVRELLFNVLENAETNEARISFQREAGSLRVIVENDGQYAPKTKQEGPLGLARIHERVELFGGMFDVTSQPGQGTQITVEVPSSTTF